MSFGSHEMVVKVTLRGGFEADILQGWIVDQADRCGVNGWSKERQGEGSVEALFAGDASNVMAMVDHLTQARETQSVSDISERPVSGHEPVWLGFHHLPPV